jgi:hypothetical protein
MYEGYFLVSLDGSTVAFSGTWPAAGICVNGKCYRLRPLVRHTSGKGYSLLGTPQFTTPTASDATGTTGGGNSRSLRDDVRMWPTMTVSDATGNRMSKGKKRPNEGGLLKAVTFPTPRASDGQKGSPNQKDSDGNPSLANIAAHYPTPCATDWKNRETSNQVGLQKTIGGQLNPEWVELLMGYPKGWTEID